MKLGYLGVALFGAALFAGASCAQNDENVPTPDAGTPPVIVANDASDDVSDASVPVDDCSDEWCSVPLVELGSVSLNAAWGSAPNDVWVVGSKGFAAHYDGSKWDTHRADTLLALFSVWGTGPNDVWAGNAGTAMFHWQGTSWEPSTLAEGDSRAVIAMSGNSQGEILALLEPSWSVTSSCDVSWGTIDVSCPSVYRLSKDGGTPAWQAATSDPFLCKSLVTDQFRCVGLDGVWAGPDGEPWLVGESGKALRPVSNADAGDLVATNDETNSVTTLESVSGASATDVWAVGASGTVRHYTGGTDWARVTVPTSEHLRAVRAVSATEAWAVGDNGTVISWNGTTWQTSAPPPSAHERGLYGIWGSSESGVWIVGEHTLLRHRTASETKR
jgi:hypothetical protein